MSVALDRTRVPIPGPPHPFRFPAVRRLTLPNGLVVLAAEVRGFPVVTFDLVMDGGGVAEPAAEGGVASLAAGLLESGAGERDAAEIAEAVDGLGLSLDSGASWDTAQAGFTSLRARADQGFAILADLVRRPSFPHGEVHRLRDERLASLTQRRGTPAALADEVAVRSIFAADTAFSRPLGGVAGTVAGLDREQVAAFHAARYRPRGAALVAAGDVSVDEAAALAQRFLGDWAGEAPPAPPPDVRPRYQRTTIVVADRPGAVQSEIRVGHVGIARSAPDFFPVAVMNAILGGVFSSRLNRTLRERLGYTYGASSSFASRRHPGTFTAQAAVQTEVTAHAVSELLREIRELREVRVGEVELGDVRAFLAGVFPLGLQTTDGVASRLATLFTYGLPDDYYAHYRDRILAVTAAQVQDAAQRRLWPDRSAIVVAGDAEKVRGPLEALDLGPVEVLDPATLG